MRKSLPVAPVQRFVGCNREPDGQFSLAMASSPFDRFIKCTLIDTWINAVNPCPLYFVVPARSEATVFGRFDSNVRIFKQSAVKFCRSRRVDALITTSVAYVPPMRNVPIGFQFASIIVPNKSQKIRATKANEEKKYAYQVFVGRSLPGIAHDSFHAATFKKLHPTVELTRRREFIQASPHQASCETRSRRSRPTICSMPPPRKLESAKTAQRTERYPIGPDLLSKDWVPSRREG